MFQWNEKNITVKAIDKEKGVPLIGGEQHISAKEMLLNMKGSKYPEIIAMRNIILELTDLYEALYASMGVIEVIKEKKLN